MSVGQYVSFDCSSKNEHCKDALTAIYDVFDRVAHCKPERIEEIKDYRSWHILHAHTMMTFGAIAVMIGEHDGFHARCEEGWSDSCPIVGLRWKWNDSMGEHVASITVQADRKTNSSEFFVHMDGQQIGNKVLWPLSSLNSDVVINICAHLMRERVHP